MSYANAWQKWFHVIEQGAAPLSRRMIELAELSPGARVLDIGTGLGEPAITLANQLDASARVLAIDRDSEMISMARARAAGQGLDNIDFEVADIESLVLADNSLDAILARWCLMFVEDLGASLERLVGALRPGGRLVFATWARAEQVPSLTLARRTTHHYFGWPEPDSGAGTPFSLSDPAAVEDLLNAIGCSEISSESVRVRYDYASAQEYLQNRLDLTGPLWDGMEQADEIERRAVFDAIETALQDYRDPDGVYRLDNLAYCFAARIR